MLQSPTLRRSLVATVVLMVLLSRIARSQVVDAGDYVVIDLSPTTVFRVTPSGVRTIIGQGAPLSAPTGIAVTADRDVVVADFNTGLYRYSSTGPALVASIPGAIRVAVAPNGDYIVMTFPAGALRRVTPSGTNTLIASGGPLAGGYDVAVDLNGDLVVVNQNTDTLLRISTTGAITTIWAGPPFTLPQNVAVLANGDYAVTDGIADTVFRVPRSGGTPTVMPIPPFGGAAFGNPCGIDVDFQGGVVVSQSGSPTPGANRIVRVDLAGNVVAIATGSPFANLEDVARAPFVSGPLVPQTGPGSLFNLNLRFPGEAGLPYTIVASTSVYPGLAFDVRGTPINPDSLFLLTFLTNLPPYTQNWNAVLDTNGQATATLDLSLFAPGQFAGTRLYLQALTIDPASPSSIRTLANTLVLPF